MDPHAILSLARLPARLDVRQTALVLGFNEHDIPILLRAKLLKCLGNAAANAPKYFAACDVQKLASPATSVIILLEKTKKLEMPVNIG